jgi:photosystem II stability/assembly factor-like uncharacterized protein
MNKKPLLVSAFILFAYQLFSQDWVKMMKNPKANVHDVEKAFYKWYPNHEKNTSELLRADDGPYEQFRRWQWFAEPRSYPSGDLPDVAVVSGQYNKFLHKNTRDKAPQSVESAANWVYKGNGSVPTNGGDGRVNKLRFLPGDINTIYACTPTGGLWKTTNGGATWSTNTDQLTELGTSDIAIDPITPTTMYLATGDCDGPGADFHSISTIGVLKSIDGGTTWNPTGLSYTQASTGPAYGTVTELAINPNNTNIIIAATSNGMYYSSNAGTTWAQEDSEYFKSVELEPFHPSTVYAATGDGKFFRSTDGGITYTQVTAGLPAFGLTARMTIAVTIADSNYVYVVAEDASSRSFYGLYQSTDRGQTFTQQSNYGSAGDLSVDYGWYGLPLTVSPTNADSILTGGLDIYLSTDGGVTWNLNASWTGSGAPYAHADVHHIIFTPGSGTSWYDACDGGVFLATDHGLNYTDLSNNLQIAEIYAIGPSTLTSGLWLSGWQDNGTNESGVTWSEVNGGDGMVPFIDFSNDNTVYSTTEDGALYNSFNGGASWNNIGSGITENGPWVTRWLQDPESANTLFAGYSNVWMSTNQGTSWTPISSFSSTAYEVSALIVDPSNDQVLYTSWPDSLFMTTNQGTNWSNITSNLPVSVAVITAIALDPNNSNHAWVTFSGYVDTAKAFQTYNGGISWTNISTGLPNLPVNCIIFQPNDNSGIYVGTDDGIYYRDTILNNWIPYNTGLPDVIVNDLKIVDAGATLLAASYGRGAWETPVYSVPTGINSQSLNNNELNVYPNPSNGNINLDVTIIKPGNYTLSVYNIMGQIIYTDAINISSHYNANLNLSEYPAGVYLITLNGQGQIMEKKVVVN